MIDSSGARASSGQGFSTQRVEELADGVFAFAMTLLILDVKLPSNINSNQLTQEVLTHWPQFLAYAGSFFIAGFFWVAHHIFFYYIKRADRFFLWINIPLLMFIAAIPFSASLFGDYGKEGLQQIMVIIYGLNLSAINLCYLGLWLYATNHGALVEKNIDPHFVRLMIVRMVIGFVAYALAILISYASLQVSLVLYILIPLTFVVPNRRFDRNFEPRNVEEHNKDVLPNKRETPIAPAQANGYAQSDGARPQQSPSQPIAIYMQPKRKRLARPGRPAAPSRSS